MPTVLNTKLYIPPVRAKAVQRQRLYQKLAEGFTRPLTLISAPAGFGKSTLVSAWYLQTHAAFPLAWVSLDGEDNDPLRFLAYLAAGFDQIQPGLGKRLLTTLDTSPSPEPRLALNVLIGDLAEFSGAGVLVLDDYHTITHAGIHDLMGALIANLPAGLHIVLVTRADPPLSLARLRVNDRLVEIRAADLLFRPEEAWTFFAETMGLSLSQTEAARLAERTEGWAAGLQLAALAAQADGRQVLETGLLSEHPYLLDYLLEEVLTHLPAEQQAFLLRTSLLEELCGPLCDAVLQCQGSARMLAAFERANLFLIPLDAERKWFRYHHLFAESLRARLQQIDPAAISELLHRAAVWYAGQERMDAAIRYALQAGDQDLAAEWIEQIAPQYLQTGQAAPVQSWLMQLDETSLRSRSRLALIWARSLYLGGDFSRCQALLDGLEQRFLTDPGEASQGYLGQIYTMRASIRSIHADWTRSIADAQQALALLPEDDRTWRAQAAQYLGTASQMVGKLPAAEEAYRLAIQAGQQSGNLYAAFTSLANQVQLYTARGQLREGDLLLKQGLQIIQDQAASGRQLIPTASLVYCQLAELSIERRDLGAAEKWEAQALELAQAGGYVVVIVGALTTSILLEIARGDLPKALTRVEQAIRAVPGAHSRGLLDPLLALRARIQLELGDLPASLRWAEEKGLAGAAENPGVDEGEAMVLLRLLRAQGQAGRVIALAERWLAAAENHERRYHALQLRLQIALARQQMGESNAATQILREALSFAYPLGFRNTFRDAGKELRPLLAALLRGASAEDALRGAARSIMELFPAEIDSPSIGANQQLVEPLTERELDVLRLLAQGESNQSIASQLVVSLGTVKAHVHHIQGKLGTRSRVELAQRARELGLA